MPLADALTAHRDIPKGPRCTTCTTISKLPKPDAQALSSALDDLSWPLQGIQRALRAEGIEIGLHSLRRHRRRECLRDSV